MFFNIIVIHKIKRKIKKIEICIIYIKLIFKIV